MSDSIEFPVSIKEDRAADLKQAIVAIHELSERFRDQSAVEKDAQTLIQYSMDSRWQVRREVAYALRTVPEELFEHIAGRLQDDSSGYVQNNVKRVSKERKELQRKLGYTQRTVDEIVDRRESFERRFGIAALKSADKLHDQTLRLIIGSMLHDIKSILTPLLSLTRDLVSTKTENHDCCSRILHSVEFLSRSVRDMEAFVRPIATNRTRECLADVVKEAAEIAKRTAQDRGVVVKKIRLLVDVPRSISLEVDRPLIVIACTNLIANAFESFYWRDLKLQFQVRVAASVTTQEIILKVEDNGVGISEEEMISRVYFVPGRLNKSKLQSTGFGLANASRYFMAHGGSMQLFSKEDEGTTVLIKIPRNDSRGGENGS